MDDLKRGSREVEDKAKEAWRKSDGDEDLGDKLGNLGDDIRREAGNLGDDAGNLGDDLGDDLERRRRDQAMVDERI